jgi:hypothetical protein
VEDQEIAIRLFSEQAKADPELNAACIEEVCFMIRKFDSAAG